MTRKLAWLGLAWAVSYLPIHVYWALGGLSRSIGIGGTQSGFRTANWGACLVILGAGLTCLSFVQAWGRLLPRRVRAGAAWIGGGFACLHWLLFTGASALRLAGAVGYPTDGSATPDQLRRFDWWNLGYFELWFGVMGVLLVVLALRTRGTEPAGPAPSRAGTALTLAGVATVVWGVFTFAAWIFAGCGPALVAAGLLTLRTRRPVPEGSLR